MKHRSFSASLLLLSLGILPLPHSHAQTEAKTSQRPEAAAEDEETYDRRIYFKLPLAQPRFHWYFVEEEVFLSGELTLTVEQPSGKLLTFPVFSDGEVSEDWETRKGKRGFYFLFRSREPVELSRDDVATITLQLPEDVVGIGADAAGVLPAGTYESQGKFTIYDREANDSDFAFLSKQDWDPHWELTLTSDTGWMEENYDREKRPLVSGPENYILSISHSDDGTRSVSVIDHSKKEFYFESFRNQEDLVEYLKENREQLPPHIACSGRGAEFVAFCEALQEELKPVQLSYFTEDGVVGDEDQYMESLKAAKYFEIYRKPKSDEED